LRKGRLVRLIEALLPESLPGYNRPVTVDFDRQRMVLVAMVGTLALAPRKEAASGISEAPMVWQPHVARSHS
jgi:hypothetical protein